MTLSKFLPSLSLWINMAEHLAHGTRQGAASLFLGHPRSHHKVRMACVQSNSPSKDPRARVASPTMQFMMWISQQGKQGLRITLGQRLGRTQILPPQTAPPVASAAAGDDFQGPRPPVERKPFGQIFGTSSSVPFVIISCNELYRQCGLGERGIFRSTGFS